MSSKIMLLMVNHIFSKQRVKKSMQSAKSKILTICEACSLR